MTRKEKELLRQKISEIIGMVRGFADKDDWIKVKKDWLISFLEQIKKV